MQTVSDFCKKEYGQKLYKLSFSAGMTCPNRDGTINEGGCIFCSAGGSGDFAVDISEYRNMHPVFAQEKSSFRIEESICKAKEKVSSKYKGDKFIAYFQAYTNTYAPVDELRNLYLNVINREDIAVISIATRPDCLNDDIYELLKELLAIKPVWVELGLQTSNEDSAQYIRRGYANEIYANAVKKLNQLGIHTITHVILYLPGETKEDMLSTVRYAVDCGTSGIKLQLLHILKGTTLEKDYCAFLEENKPDKVKSEFNQDNNSEYLYSKSNNMSLPSLDTDGQKLRKKPTDNKSYSNPGFTIPTLEEYVAMVKSCVEIIPEHVIIHRLTGDPPKKLLVEPKWTGDKKRVINAIDEALNPQGPYYVYILRCGDGSLYTGSTNDVNKRLAKHQSGKGAKYTMSHQPVELVYKEEFASKRAALKRECEIKKLSRRDKLELIMKEKTNHS